MNNDEVLRKMDETVRLAKAKSFFYHEVLDGIDKFIDTPLLSYQDIADNCLSMITCNIRSITRRNYCDRFIRCYNKDTEKAEREFWSEYMKQFAPLYKVLFINEKNNRQFELLADAVEAQNGTVSVYDTSDPISKAAQLLTDRDITIVIGKQKYLLAIGQYIEKNAVSINLKHVIIMNDHLNKVVNRRISSYFNAEIHRIKYISECGLIIGTENDHKGYKTLPYLYTEIISPTDNQIMKDGEYGLLVVSTPEDHCQPLIRYNTEHFTRKVRNTDLIDLESTVYDKEEDLDSIIYRFEGTIYYEKIEDIIEIEALKQINEEKLYNEIKKKYNYKYIVKYVDDYTI